MTNDLVTELKALIKEGSGYNPTMTIEPLEDSEWCSITTSSIDVCGDNVVIYARRMNGMIELSDFGVTDLNIDDEYKNIIKIECKIWHLIYGLGKRTDIHTAAAARPEDFCYAFAQIDWATTSINNIAAYQLKEGDYDDEGEEI
jgi:hypothetical protein